LFWEFPIAFCREQQGFDLTRISNQDTRADPRGLHRAPGFLSVGHDEYWTPEMFRSVQKAVRDGPNVALLAGIAVCGRIQLSADTAGHPTASSNGPSSSVPPGAPGTSPP
jgi:hypothetical protein